MPKLKTLCSGELHDSSDDSLVSGDATKPATAPNCVTYDQLSVNVDDEETVPQDVSVGLQNLPTSDFMSTDDIIGLLRNPTSGIQLHINQ